MYFHIQRNWCGCVLFLEICHVSFPRSLSEAFRSIWFSADTDRLNIGNNKHNVLKTCEVKWERHTEKAMRVYPVSIFSLVIVVSMALLSDIHYWNSNSMNINEPAAQKPTKEERKAVKFIKTTHIYSYLYEYAHPHRHTSWKVFLIASKYIHWYCCSTLSLQDVICIEMFFFCCCRNCLVWTN